METKKCSKCGKEKPATLQYFHKRLDGLQNRCKPCLSKSDSSKKEYMKKYNKQFYTLYKDKKQKAADNWKWRKSGVYAIYEMGKCLYVGESTQLNKRISNHKYYLHNPEAKCQTPNLYKSIRQHTNWIIGILEETDNHVEREQFYINKLKPLYNA